VKGHSIEVVEKLGEARVGGEKSSMDLAQTTGGDSTPFALRRIRPRRSRRTW
jgi:hypothetical protein